MYISKITIQNYRSYKNARIEIPYFPDTNKTITIFSGKIGAGKTTLFNAIGWCLTGKESQEILGSKSHEKGVPNDTSFVGNSTAKVSVELEIAVPEDHERKRITIRRDQTFRKKVKDPISQEISLDIYYSSRVKQLSSRDEQQSREIGAFLRETFPEILSRFYMFDGEFLVQTYSERGANIGGALKGFFRIGAVVTLQEYLGELWRDYAKKIQKMKQSKKLDALNGDYDSVKKELESLDAQIKVTEGEFFSLGEQIKQLDVELESIAVEKATAKEKEKEHKKLESLRERKKDLEKANERKKLELWGYVLENSHVINMRREFDTSIRNIEAVEESGDLPPKIKETFISDLLSKSECICGTSLLPGTHAREKVEGLLADGRSAERRTVLLELRPIIKNLVKGEKQISANIVLLEEAIQKVTTEILQVGVDIKNITVTSFDQASQEIIDRYERKKTEKDGKTALRDAKNVSLTKLKEKVRRLSDNLEELRQQIEDEGRKGEGTEAIQEFQSLTGKLMEIFAGVPDHLLEEFASRLQETTNSLVLTIPELKGKSAKVEIGDQRKLDFFLQEGGETAYLTGGQSQIAGKLLISSFVKIVSELKHFLNIPFIIMDHPFSNYDMAAKNYMPGRLGGLFNQAQLIIFVPDTEVDEFLRNSNGTVSKAYWIDNSSGDGSTVKEMGSA